jgi:transposase
MRPGSAAWIARRCATGFIGSTRPVLTACATPGRAGPAPRLSAAQKAQLADIIEAGPDREVDGVVRWRRIDLKRIIAARFGVDYHERYVGTLLKELGFSHSRRQSPQSECVIGPTSVNPNNRWYYWVGVLFV